MNSTLKQQIGARSASAATTGEQAAASVFGRAASHAPTRSDEPVR